MSCISSLLMIDYCYHHRLSGAVECTLPNPLETGVQVRLMSSVGWHEFLFHPNYKVKYNHCDEFIRCIDGALKSLEVNTLSSSGSDPRKNVYRGATVVIYWSSWKKCFPCQIKYRRNTVVFHQSSCQKNIRGNTVVFIKWNVKEPVVFYLSSWKTHKG